MVVKTFLLNTIPAYHMLKIVFTTEYKNNYTSTINVALRHYLVHLRVLAGF